MFAGTCGRPLTSGDLSARPGGVCTAGPREGHVCAPVWRDGDGCRNGAWSRGAIVGRGDAVWRGESDRRDGPAWYVGVHVRDGAAATHSLRGIVRGLTADRTSLVEDRMGLATGAAATLLSLRTKVWRGAGDGLLTRVALTRPGFGPPARAGDGDTLVPVGRVRGRLVTGDPMADSPNNAATATIPSTVVQSL